MVSLFNIFRISKYSNSIYLIGLLYYLLFIFSSCDREPDDPIRKNCESSAVFNPEKEYGVVVDQEGNVYKTIQIGSQTWMAENLRTTIYRNGEKIPEVKGQNTWNNLTSDAYCNYNNTGNSDSICTFGRLYNWNAVIDERKIAPEGWHIPSLEEWLILEAFLVDSVAADKLKESGYIHWEKVFGNGGNNDTGFTALPGGWRWVNFTEGLHYFGIGEYGGWWTATEDSEKPANAYHVKMSCSYGFLGGCFCDKDNGYSIRCIKD